MMPRRSDRFEALMRHSSGLPTERPTYYAAPGLRAARDAANTTVEEVAEQCGYGPSVIRSMEAGRPHHAVSISRVASVILGHDLSQIRDEND